MNTEPSALVHELSTEVREIIARFGLMSRGSSIQLLEHYFPEMTRKQQEMAGRAMTSLETGVYFDTQREIPDPLLRTLPVWTRGWLETRFRRAS